MKVMLVYTNINGFHDNYYSPGLAYLVSSTIAAGHEVSLELVKTVADIPRLEERFRRNAPAVLGLSAVSSQFAYVKNIAERLKSIGPRVFVLCGGVHPTIHPKCLLEAPVFDGAILGEAEIAFAELLARMEAGEEPTLCANFAYVSGGQVIRNEMKPLIADLDSLPAPDKDTYPYREAVESAGHAPFFFSRGCPYPCTYCCNHAIARAYGEATSVMRYRGPEACVTEIESALLRFPLERIVIRDDIFGMNPRWREEFCTLYRKRIARPFSVFSRVEVVSERYCRSLAEAGCQNISMAIESGNATMRAQVLDRAMSDEVIVEAFELAAACGIGTTALNMIGLPGETEEMILETVLLNRRVKPTDTRANVFYPYRGTNLGDKCFADGLVDEERYAAFSNERRESVLRFPVAHLERLIWYHRNWKSLIDSPELSDELLHLSPTTPSSRSILSPQHSTGAQLRMLHAGAE